TAEEPIAVKFLFYVLKNNIQQFRDMASGMGSLPQISLPVTEEFLIPVPPIEVQREIVRILDKFSEFTAELTMELTKELTARKKQYEYFRDTLLTFGDDVDKKTLGEICNISAGGDAPKEAMSKEKTDIYTIPIISNGIGDNALYGYTNIAKITNPAVTIAARGTIGYAEYRNYPYFPIIRLLTILPKDVSVVDTKYLYYCMYGKQYSVPMGGIPQLTAPELKKVEISVPPLEEQRRIVSILDRFDALCSDLSSGLPAEIEARQKQYEYYRDKLLTFQPIS
ncbi:MAG: restriction endonuclease subunit S, partial [Eubacteriales bacterium]